jgi:hypothetical protein
MIKYKSKVVCFIDILGFGEMVKTEFATQPEKIHDVLSKIKVAVMKWSGEPITQDMDLQITQFSDSIVFSFVPTKHYFMNFSFFKELCVSMVEEEIVFRGGVTYGLIFHDHEFVFGPAMNEAYRLESKMAEFPRIIIDEPAMNLTDNEGKTIKQYTGQFVLKIVDEGYSYVDYIYDVFPYAMNQSTYYDKMRGIIVKGLQSKDTRIVAKYEWMKVEYNNAQQTFVELQPL